MRFFVGTYSVPGSPGIAFCTLDKNEIHITARYAELLNPTWVTWHPGADCLFALGKNPDGDQVVASLRPEEGQLRLVSQVPTGGNSSCHLTVSPKGDFLVASHYHEGRVSLYPLHQATIGPQLQLVQQHGTGPVKGRQDSPHAHQSVFRPGTQEVFVCDLGADRIFIYQLNEKLTQKGNIAAPAGSGPRHLVFDGPDRLYACGELSSEVLYYQADEDGAWSLMQRVSTLPEPVSSNTCAAIRLFEGQVSVSNRGHDSIALFNQNDAGMLTPAGHLPSRGKTPRDFVRLKRGFMTANQHDGGVQYFDIAGQPIASLEVPGAVCIAPQAEDPQFL